MKKKNIKPPSAPVDTVPAWKPFLGWGVLVWILFVVFRFDQKFPCSMDPALNFVAGIADFSPLSFLKIAFGYLKTLSLFVVIAAGVLSWGMVAVRRYAEQDTPSLDICVLSALIGFLGLSLLTAAAGFLGLLKPAELLLMTAAFTGSGVYLARGHWSALRTGSASFSYSSLVDSPVKLLLIVLCGLAFLMAFVPELFYDSLVYHLGLPQMYINEGRIIDTPHVYFSRSPMSMHMLYTLALGLDGSSLAKLMNWSFFMIGIGGAFVLCGKLGWRRAAPWAALFFAAVPIVQMNVWTTAVDASMAGVFSMATYALLRWVESEKKLFWAALVGLFSGAVFATKYPGIMVVALMGIALFLLSLKRLSERPVLLSLVLYAVMACVPISPWLVRNFIWTGNPVYPIASNVFESRHMNHEKMEDEIRITKRSKPASIGAFIAYPWTQTMLELSNFNFVGPMLLSLLPLVLFLPFKEPSARIVTMVTFGYFFLSLQALGELRYIMPGFLLLSIVLAGGLSALSNASKLCGWFVKTAVFCTGMLQLAWIFQSADGHYRPWPVLFGSVSRADYSATMHNGLNLWPWNGMADDLRKLPESCRVYILGTEQVFGFPRRFWYSSCHDDTPLVLWANESASGAALYDKLKSQGFTHILLNIPGTVHLKGYNIFMWTENGKKVFTDFANQHLKVVDVKPIEGYANSLFLFEIDERLAAPSPVGDFGVFFKDVLHLGPQ